MKTNTHSSLTWLDRQAAAFEFNRFALMAILITFQSCLGSITAMLSLQQDNYFTLAVIAAVTMGANAVFIAQGSAKMCMIFFYATVIINLVLLLGLII